MKMKPLGNNNGASGALIVLSLMLLLAGRHVLAQDDEPDACKQAIDWFGTEDTDACWLNAPFSGGELTSCNQLEPDEQQACKDLCQQCFDFCNANCFTPTTIFENNVEPLVAGCSCVQSPEVSPADSVTVASAATAATIAVATAAVGI